MNPPEIVIRAGQVEDLPLIWQFIRELAVYERLEADFTGSERDLGETLFGARPLAKVLLAFLNNEPAGFAVYLFTFSTFAARPILYLEDLFVRPPARGHGVARRLIEELARVAGENRCVRMEWSVLDWNETAIRFYESLGAKAQKQWLKYAFFPGGRIP